MIAISRRCKRDTSAVGGRARRTQKPKGDVPLRLLRSGDLPADLAGAMGRRPAFRTPRNGNALASATGPKPAQPPTTIAIGEDKTPPAQARRRSLRPISRADCPIPTAVGQWELGHRNT
jgi:hypothetical protein